MGFSRSSQFLTQHPHEDFIDPGEDADDVEGGEGNVEEEADADLDAFVLATLPAAEEGKSGNGGGLIVGDVTLRKRRSLGRADAERKCGGDASSPQIRENSVSMRSLRPARVRDVI